MTVNGLEQIQRITKRMLADLDPVVERITSMLQDSSPSYRGVPAAQLRPTVRQTLESALLALSLGRLPTTEEVAEVVAGVQTRARQGVPVDDVLVGFITGVRELWKLIRKEAGDIDLESQLEAAELLWAWDDKVTVEAIVVHRIAELEVARQDQYKRLAFVSELIKPGADPESIAGQARDLGLSAEVAYLPFRARPTGQLTVEELENNILASSEQDPIITAIVDGDVVGVAPDPPTLPDSEVRAGVGPRSVIPDLGRALELATRTLDTADRAGRFGSFTFDDLSIEAAVVSDPTVGKLLIERFVAPVEANGRRGEQILDTVDTYFRSGREVEKTAEALGLHPNSIRYRLRRFEELSGASLSRTEDLVGIWWAITQRALDPPAATPR